MNQSGDIGSAKAFIQCLALLCVFLPLLWLWLKATLEALDFVTTGRAELYNLKLLFDVFFCVLVGCLGSGWFATTFYLVRCFGFEDTSASLYVGLAVPTLVMYALLIFLTCQFWSGLRADLCQTLTRLGRW